MAGYGLSGTRRVFTFTVDVRIVRTTMSSGREEDFHHPRFPHVIELRTKYVHSKVDL